MTQLDEDAVCGSIGYAACLLQLVYIIYTSCDAGGLQSRAKTFGCSTSSWLSGKIRSQASPPHLLLLYSSSPSVCLFIPLFIYLFLPLSAAAHIPALPSHIPLLSDCISSLAVLLLSICLFAAPLSVLISVIRLPGISWD